MIVSPLKALTVCLRQPYSRWLYVPTVLLYFFKNYHTPSLNFNIKHNIMLFINV